MFFYIMHALVGIGILTAATGIIGTLFYLAKDYLKNHKDQQGQP